MAKNEKPKGIDLFAGAGGLSLGARMAGLNVTHAVEQNGAAAATYRKNHRGTEVINEDVRNAFVFLKNVKCDILFAGPPCQGFSVSNQKTRTRENPKNWLFIEVFRYVRALHPKLIVIENVTGLTETANGFFLKAILAEFQELRYQTTVWVLNAAEFGVPQRRKRLFIIASKGRNLPNQLSVITRMPVTVRDAISDLPLLLPGANVNIRAYGGCASSNYAISLRGNLDRCTGHLTTANNELVLKRYKHVPPGGNWRNIPRRLMRNYTNLVDSRSRHTGIYYRLQWDEPSIVIANFRKNMLIHPSQNRGLSVREAARIQSFPDSYEFQGSIGLQQQQISNAVPPLLAKAVFEALIDD